MGQHEGEQRREQNSPLDLALAYGKKEIAEILRGKGAKCKQSAGVSKKKRQQAQERVEGQKKERNPTENKRGEEMKKVLTNIQCPNRIVEFLLQEKNQKERKENEMVQQMTDGRIPMGFSSHSLWSETHEKVS